MAFPNIIRKIVDLIERMGEAETAITQKAPTSHAATATTYGKGTDTLYGHVKLSDATNGSAGVSGGTAATPAAVKAAYKLADTANQAAGSAAEKAQQAINAISGVQTTANNAMPKSGGTFTGNVVHLQQANIVLDITATATTVGTVVKYPLQTKHKTTGGTTHTNTLFWHIPSAVSNNYGAGILIQPGGGLALASGEGGSYYIKGAGVDGNAEHIYLASDKSIYFISNLHPGYESRKIMTFTTAGNLVLPDGATISGAATFKGKADTAGTATKLATARSLKVALGSTAAVTFDGSAAQNAIPVSGVLGVSNGGTGKNNLNGLVQTGNVDQTIGGVKTFTAGVRVTNNSNSHFVGKESVWTVGTAASDNALIKGLVHVDKNDVHLGNFYHNIGDSNDFSFWVWSIRKNATAASQCAGSILGYEMRFLARGKSDTAPATFAPWATSTNYSSNINLGESNNARRWANIYTKASSVTTSDKRLKDFIADVPDAVLDAWEKVQWRQYKLKESITLKGRSARLHNGLVAQDVAAVFKTAGLNAASYGLFCHDYSDTPGEPDIYSIRYEEALAMEAAYQRREAQRANKRIKELEERIERLEAHTFV